MAKIALVGASGLIGSRILDEAVTRGHQVTAIVRQPERVATYEAISVKQADIADVETALPAVHGADALVVSIRWNDNAEHVLNVARLAGVPRMIVVVGAGSLQARPGVPVIDAPEFPPAWRPGAEAATRALAVLRNAKDVAPHVDWVAVSPSWTLTSGERTGRFRVGADELLRDEHGHSRISREDLAVAVIDEVERPRHHRQRITIGY